MKNQRMFTFLVLGVLIISACNMFSPAFDNGANNSEDNPLLTQSALTLAAILSTQSANITATIEHIQSSTPTNVIPTETATQIPPTPIPLPCNAAKLVADVSIPDFTKLPPDTNFTKTWRIKNVGSCTWLTDFELVFVSGNLMEANSNISLQSNVLPGETIDIDIDFKSPNTIGPYKSYWMLRTSSAVNFGIGDTAKEVLWVEIEVVSPANSGSYSFADEFCKASWRNVDKERTFECAGTNINGLGFSHFVSTPRLEGGAVEDEPALWIYVPNNGKVDAQYPAIEISTGDKFVSIVGCIYNYTNCHVDFKLKYKVEGESGVHQLGSWDETYDETYSFIDIDLSSLDGKKVIFILEMESKGNSPQNHVFWLNPNIQHP